MFDSEVAYKRVKEADVLTNETIQKLYRVCEKDIITNMYFDPAMAWKCTIKRPWAQGSVGERDTLGTQQHAPLLGNHIPVSTTKLNGASTDVINAATPCGFDSQQTYINGARSTYLDRKGFRASDIVAELWKGMGLPDHALRSLSLPGNDNDSPILPSSYKIGALAQSSIAISALAAGQVHALRNKSAVPRVEVPQLHAVIEFKSERLYRLDGKPAPNPWGAIGGLHKTSDGYVRIHDSFSNHRDGSLELLGLPLSASRSDVADKVSQWASIDLESVSVLEKRLATYALRSYQQWDMLSQSKAIDNLPISMEQIAPGPKGLPTRLGGGNDKCLRGLRVLEMSRVIAAPLAGKTLAAHGADVLWVTSPNLPDLPTMDRDLGRGKRTIQLDVNSPKDFARLKELILTADVFIQGFRPDAVAGKGLSPEELMKLNPGLICANMSAFGPKGPWSGRRGFDSLVQTCSGMNVSEAEHRGAGEAARPTPCQALDHAGGYLLATGIIGALCRRAAEGGSWRVDVSLAGVMKYFRSLGQYPGKTGFESRDYERADDVEEFLEAQDSGFGRLEAVRHSATVESCAVGWEIMPKPLGSDQAEWLD